MCEHPCVIERRDAGCTVTAAIGDEKEANQAPRSTVRHADLSGADGDHVARLVGAYLRQTEREKAEHLALEPPVELPEGYRAEVHAPEKTFADAVVLLAELSGAVVGVAVLKHGTGDTEIKRFWAEPQARGHGVGSALLDAVLAEVSGTISLTVWSWRARARELYESRGFVVVPSWDHRAGLVCMQRSGTVVA
jgi:GNAT superfamily N-acetyltransferase